MSRVNSRTSVEGGAQVSSALRALAERFHEATPALAVRRACESVRIRVGENVPPIGLRPILASLNARLIEQQLASAGRLEVDESGYRVVVRAGQSWRRQRFTIAHEIGHLIICEALADSVSHLHELRSPTLWPQVESLCNLAAAELLMPSDDFTTAAPDMTPTAAGFYRLYDRYLCSRAALFTRFAVLFPGLSVTIWKHHARHPGDRATWRVTQVFRSDNVPWIPLGLTTSHLTPDLVRRAAQFGAGTEQKMLFELNSRHMPQSGIAFALAGAPPRSRRLPDFQGLRVLDELAHTESIVLFLWPRATNEESTRHLDNLLQQRVD